MSDPIVDNSTVTTPTDTTGTSPAKAMPGGLVLVDSRFSVDALKTDYLFGMRLENSSGQPFPESLFYNHLNAAIQSTSALLDIVITPKEFIEEHDYHADDFTNWGYLKLFKKPALDVSKIDIMFADRQVTEFPKDWLKLTKNNSQVRLVPNMGSINSLIITADGALMQNFYGCNHYPQMWKITYTAGFEDVPYELYDYIYKKACINVIQVWYNMFYLGNGSSESISIDGLSQSVTKAPVQIYNQYNSELASALSTLKSRYDEIRFAVL